MSAASADRRHVRGVELALETRVTLEHERALDAREDVARARGTKALRVALSSIREEAEFDKLADVQRDRAIALITELAGILDGVEQIALPLEVAS